MPCSNCDPCIKGGSLLVRQMAIWRGQESRTRMTRCMTCTSAGSPIGPGARSTLLSSTSRRSSGIAKTGMATAVESWGWPSGEARCWVLSAGAPKEGGGVVLGFSTLSRLLFAGCLVSAVRGLSENAEGVEIDVEASPCVAEEQAIWRLWHLPQTGLCRSHRALALEQLQHAFWRDGLAVW